MYNYYCVVLIAEMTYYGQTSQEVGRLPSINKLPPPPTELSALPVHIVFVPKVQSTATCSLLVVYKGRPTRSAVMSSLLQQHIYLPSPIFPSVLLFLIATASCQNSARKATRQEGRLLHQPSCQYWRCSCLQPWQFCTWHVRAQASSPICGDHMATHVSVAGVDSVDIGPLGYVADSRGHNPDYK